MNAITRWAPGSILSVGVIFTLGLGPQGDMELRHPLAEAVPGSLLGLEGQPVQVSDEEARVAGFDDYVFRLFGEGQSAFSVYVGFYGSQTRGRTIHSPKNCLPGSGWEALASYAAIITTNDGREVTVNRYVLQREDARALVLYWYQGRGRIAHDEYLVKWDLLRDAALYRRSDEALVRIVVPIEDGEDAAFATAARVAEDLIPAVDAALPAWASQ